jgi:hypothetical protein
MLKEAFSAINERVKETNRVHGKTLNSINRDSVCPPITAGSKRIEEIGSRLAIRPFCHRILPEQLLS